MWKMIRLSIQGWCTDESNSAELMSECEGTVWRYSRWPELSYLSIKTFYVSVGLCQTISFFDESSTFTMSSSGLCKIINPITTVFFQQLYKTGWKRPIEINWRLNILFIINVLQRQEKETIIATSNFLFQMGNEEWVLNFSSPKL